MEFDKKKLEQMFGMSSVNDETSDWHNRPFWKYVWPSLVGASVGFLTRNISLENAGVVFLLLALIIMFLYKR